MSFGLGNVLPKELLHQVQFSVLAAAASYTVVVRAYFSLCVQTVYMIIVNQSLFLGRVL